MTLPRPVLIALLGLALCAAAFLATRSASDTGSAVTASPAPQPVPLVKHPAKPVKPVSPVKQHSAVKQHGAAPATARTATAAKPVARPATPPKPAVSPEVAKTLPVIKALGRGDVVVFFFTQPGPADDSGTAAAVRSLSHHKGISVFKVGMNELEAYRPVLAGAGVSQVPAVVVVKAGHKARLLQGFVDPETLRQTVADARR